MASSSRRFCMAIWLVLSSAVLALIGVFVGTLGALMQLSGLNDTVAIYNDTVRQTTKISSSSRLYGLYGDRLFEVLSPIDRNLNNRQDQIDFTLIFGRWHLDLVFLVLGWTLAGSAVLSILLPILKTRPSRRSNSCCSSFWSMSLGFCMMIFSVYDVALVCIVILYYIFRDQANIYAVEYINTYAFGERYGGDRASDYRTSSPETFSFTLLMNFVQRTYSCCGFFSYRDYAGGAARLWTQQNLLLPSPATLPLVCCADLTSNAAANGVTLEACRSDISSGNYRANNWNTLGCYQSVVSDLGQRVSIGLTAAVSMLIVILSAALIAGCILISMERNHMKSLASKASPSRRKSQLQRLDQDWAPKQAQSPAYSGDEEEYYHNKLYAQRF